MKRSFRVTLEMPDGVTVPEMKEYIRDAVRSQSGLYPIDDPLFCLDKESVGVVSIRKPRKKGRINSWKNLSDENASTM